MPSLLQLLQMVEQITQTLANAHRLRADKDESARRNAINKKEAQKWYSLLSNSGTIHNTEKQ